MFGSPINIMGDFRLRGSMALGFWLLGLVVLNTHGKSFTPNSKSSTAYHRRYARKGSISGHKGKIVKSMFPPGSGR